jgi:hypothetical protein
MLLIQKHLICDADLIRRSNLTIRVFELVGVFVLLIVLLKGMS